MVDIHTLILLSVQCAIHSKRSHRQKQLNGIILISIWIRLNLDQIQLNWVDQRGWIIIYCVASISGTEMLLFKNLIVFPLNKSWDCMEKTERKSITYDPTFQISIKIHFLMCGILIEYVVDNRMITAIGRNWSEMKLIIYQSMLSAQSSALLGRQMALMSTGRIHWWALKEGTIGHL